MTPQDYIPLEIPDWVLALADDHLSSLRQLFCRADEKRSQVHAIQTHRAHGKFPADLGLTLDVSALHSMSISTSALNSAECTARREQELILMQIATARLNLTRSMASTLRMMSRAAEARGRKGLSQHEIEAYKKWFADRLDAAILKERLKMKRSAAGRRRALRNSVMSSRGLAIIRAGKEN